MIPTYRLYFGSGLTTAPSGWRLCPSPVYKPAATQSQGNAWENIDNLASVLREFPSPQITDLYTVMWAGYAADRWISRSKDITRNHSSTSGVWTRRFDLDIPVQEPDRWNDPRVISLIRRLFGFMTSDEWKVSFRAGQTSSWQGAVGFREVFSRVSLFSGGLDSFCHTASLKNEATLLVSFQNQSRIDTLQTNLAKVLPGHTRRGSFRVQVNRLDSKSETESTQRTRSLLFMAAGLVACSGNNLSTLDVPENGMLAFNPSLTPSRPGACMTHSVHPTAMGMLNELLQLLGTPHYVHNPSLYLTKGEVCDAALGGNIDLSVLAQTITCSNPHTRSSKEFSNCGKCYPCLVRHSGLAHAGGDKTVYRITPRKALNSPHGRALRDWLANPFTAFDLIASTPFPDDADLDRLTDVILRSRTEIAKAFELVAA